ncbi:Uncharacterized protein SCF082_LOCUS19306 [Durusdinium trenchii]|uniref:Sulfotransferase domain-containing protein n=1 Tax=Durusdinium trenchii TaxID=1381693 RepID=A0ABP0KUX1_9DINO
MASPSGWVQKLLLLQALGLIGIYLQEQRDAIVSAFKTFGFTRPDTSASLQADQEGKFLQLTDVEDFPNKPASTAASKASRSLRSDLAKPVTNLDGSTRSRSKRVKPPAADSTASVDSRPTKVRTQGSRSKRVTPPQADSTASVDSKGSGSRAVQPPAADSSPSPAATSMRKIRPILRAAGPVPSLVIAGADKGGTSEAYAMLAREFQVVDKGQEEKKELGCLYLVMHGAQAVQQCYLQYFGQLQSNMSKKVLPIDATPNYYYSNQFYARYISPPKILAQVAPSATILFLLREPVSRARSLYNHFLISVTGYDLTGTLEEQLEEELVFLNRSAPQTLLNLFVDARCVQQTDCNMWHYWHKLREKYQETARNFRRNRRKDVDNKRIISFILSSMYFPFIYTWVQSFDRVALMESEYFFQDTSRLWQLLQIPRSESSEDYRRPENRALTYDATSQLSDGIQKRLKQVFHRPNTLLRKYLSKLETRGFSVFPSVGSNSWWAAGDPLLRPHKARKVTVA